MRDLWRVIAPYRLRLAAALACLLLAKFAIVAVPLVLKRIVDSLSRPEMVHALPIFLLAGYAALRFSSTLFNELRDLVFARIRQSTLAGYAQAVFAHLHQLGARFHSARRIGALLADIDRGTNGIGFLLGIGLFTIVPTLIEIGLVIAIMRSRYSDWYTAIIVLTFVGYAAFTLLFTARRAIHQRQVIRLDGDAKNRLADSLINHDAVKAFTNEALEMRRFRGIMQNWTEAVVANQVALCILHVGQSAIIGAGIAAVMLQAGRDVLQAQLTVGDLVLINAYMIQVCLPLNALGFIYREAKDALINAEKLFRLLHEKPEVDEPLGLPPLRLDRSDVVFEQVGFGYEENHPVLCDINLRIAQGSTVAVVGGSGSGKSTLARLLMRFYDTRSGRITIGGQDIREVSSRSVRAAIGVVPQETILFNDTVAYNIAYGRPEASFADIVAAAQAAYLHEAIEALPEKYETAVGERGAKLSGGEKQRISLARAILKNPPILIFDEATSALDVKSERAIQVELERLARGRTTLIIAHRLSTVMRADEIVVMERGRIVERGTHGALMQRGATYWQMWQLQQVAEPERVEPMPAIAELGPVAGLGSK